MKIFRCILALIFVVVTTPFLWAQDTDTRKEVKHLIGIKAGQNLSWLRLDPSVEQNIMKGPVFGISYTYMSQYFGGLMLEAQYIQYGWEEVLTGYKRSLTYFEFPVLTNLVIGKKKTHLKLQGGIKIAALLNQTDTIPIINDGDTIADIVDPPFYYEQEVEDKFELGMAFGGSVSRVFSFGEIQLDVRYNTAISNLFEPTKDLSLLYSQNQAITVSMYYLFKFKR